MCQVGDLRGISTSSSAGFGSRPHAVRCQAAHAASPAQRCRTAQAWCHVSGLGCRDHRSKLLTKSAYQCAGEESVEQIGSRAERMGLMGNSNIFLYSATRMDVRPL